MPTTQVPLAYKTNQGAIVIRVRLSYYAAFCNFFAICITFAVLGCTDERCQCSRRGVDSIDTGTSRNILRTPATEMFGWAANSFVRSICSN